MKKNSSPQNIFFLYPKTLSKKLTPRCHRRHIQPRPASTSSAAPASSSPQLCYKIQRHPLNGQVYGCAALGRAGAYKVAHLTKNEDYVILLKYREISHNGCTKLVGGQYV
jgi:hypothetical protein